MRKPLAIAALAAALLAATMVRPAAAFDLRAALASAEPGAVIHVPAGVHPGPLVIDKPVTLLAERGAILQGRGDADVVQVRAPDVTLRGFLIRGTGISLERENAGVSVFAPRVRLEDNTLEDVLFGLYLKNAPHSVIRNNTVGAKDLDLGRRGDGIRLWYSSDSLVEGNRVDRGRDVVMWFSPRTHVLGNTVTNGRYGLHFMYSDDDVVEANRAEGNSVGVFVMYSKNLRLRKNSFLRNRGPSGYGIGLKDVDGLVAEDNRFVGNRIGVYLDNSPASIGATGRFQHNLLAYNDIGLAFLPNVTHNVITENNFRDNLEQVAIFGGGQLHDNAFSENGRGNFWSDYAGYDLAGTGVGQVPYRSQSLFENLLDRDPRLRLFLFSPAQQAVELAAMAFPAFRPRVKFTDEHPLMAPVVLDGPPLEASSSHAMAGIGAALLALAGAALATARMARARHSTSCPADLSPKGTAMLRVDGLTKQFGTLKAVNDLSFSVQPGEALALWGPNGAGKTTVLRCVLGLLKSQGRISVAGHDLGKDPKAVRRALGYVPQELNFYEDCRVREVLGYFARIKRVDRSRVETVLDEVGLAPHAGKRVGALSGGMKQRLALAAALLADPPLLLLDEMTSSLDAAARQGFLELLNGQKHAGKAILFISHRLEEVEGLADRVLVLDHGAGLLECHPAELAEGVGLRARLKVIVPPAQIEPAVTALTAAGFAARRNGRGVYVDVALRRKAHPIEALLQRGVAVQDFEIDNGPAPSTGVPGEVA